MIVVTPIEDRKIRTVWYEARETWYFAIVYMVAALTDSPNPTDYLKKCGNGMVGWAFTQGQTLPQRRPRKQPRQAPQSPNGFAGP
jgi:hypothetical protein